jgi:hypothetical protein
VNGNSAAFLTSTQGYGMAIDWQLAVLNPEVIVMNKKDKGSDKEPDWMNPANDRKTPYTEEEIDAFVEDFIIGLDEQEWFSITSEHGEAKARKKIRTAFVNMDENSLVNMSPKGSIN